MDNTKNRGKLVHVLLNAIEQLASVAEVADCSCSVANDGLVRTLAYNISKDSERLASVTEYLRITGGARARRLGRVRGASAPPIWFGGIVEK